MTQLEAAKNNKVTPLMKKIAAVEKMPVELLIKRIAEGKIVIPVNKNRKISKPCGIGLGLSTKINANIGTSTDRPNLKEELEKVRIAQKYGADAIMDLSVGSNIKEIRRKILEVCNVPLGTVPIYEIAVAAEKKYGNFLKLTSDDVLSCLESQAKEGVDFFTIHSGVNKKTIEILKKNKRILDIVSRGGAMMASWINHNKKENPFYEYFDKILDIAYAYDVTLSLGDGMRPGSIFDATDKTQIEELKILGELAQRAKKHHVQVMIEGPGHVPLNQIIKNMQLEKQYCHQAPFYVLGPLVTDVGAGYDHITGAIGGAIAATAGADFLCYLTPAEHLRHPSKQDVREGVVASKIAAHAADIVKGVPQALEWDKKMSIARKKRDWKKQIALSVDPDKAREYRASSKPHQSDVCTMCGNYCSIKLMDKCMRE